MRKNDTMKKTVTKHDWSRFEAMSEEEKHAAALSDPDAQPLTPERGLSTPESVTSSCVHHS